MSEDAPPKVIGLFDKKPVEQVQTPAEVIKILEETLASARAGNMSAVAIASVGADRTASTVAWSDIGFGNELLATIDVLHYRRMKFLLEE